jgi:hypothetical protein
MVYIHISKDPPEQTPVIFDWASNFLIHDFIYLSRGKRRSKKEFARTKFRLVRVRGNPGRSIQPAVDLWFQWERLLAV